VDLNIEGIGFTCADGWFGNSVKCRMETDLYERSKSWLRLCWNEGELCKVGKSEVWFCSMVKAPELGVDLIEFGSVNQRS
jgi:hypothetical protein